MCCHPDQIIFLNTLFSPLYRLNEPPALLSEQEIFLSPVPDRVSDTDAAQLGKDLVSQYADRDRAPLLDPAADLWWDCQPTSEQTDAPGHIQQALVQSKRLILIGMSA